MVINTLFSHLRSKNTTVKTMGTLRLRSKQVLVGKMEGRWWQLIITTNNNINIFYHYA